MGKRKLGALEKIDADLASLQYKIRKDPSSYREEFIKQHEQYEAQKDIFMADPASNTAHGAISLRDLIDFMAHVADNYPELTASFPNDLAAVLTMHHANLEAELREKIVSSLVLLRKKGLIDSPKLLLTLFPILTTTSSKSLRTLLLQKILSDLRSSNAKAKNHPLNRTVQTVLFNLLSSDRSSPRGLWAVKLTRELWKRQVWTDSKAVEIMKEASLADNAKVATGGVRFFLGVDQDLEEDEESDEEDAMGIGKLKHQVGINKKSKKNIRALEKAVATVKRKERRKNQTHSLNFSALHLLHDPQGFADALFSKHLQNSKSNLNLQQKLLVLQLVSRLVGLHRLTLISLYSYFLKYLTPRQPSVTSFLASLAQSTHNLVPPDILEPLVQKIANEFVSEAAASEVACAGLNAIREICVRQPLAMSDTLLQDLVMYRKSKDKGVMMASKSLLSLYREVGPEMLKKRDRGKEAVMGLKAGEKRQKRFGEMDAEGIEGIELLESWRAERERAKEDEGQRGSDGSSDAEDESGWDEEEEESDNGSRGWINVESDRELSVSSSDDGSYEAGKPPAKKPKSTVKDDLEDEGDDQENDDDDDERTTSPSTLPQDTSLNGSTKVSTLATTKILTPADLAKLHELKTQASVNKLLGKSPSSSKNAPNKRVVSLASTSAAQAHDPEARLTAQDISSALPVGSSKKASKAAAQANNNGDDDEDGANRHRHRSKAYMRQERKNAAGKSTTNKEKARRKNMLMTLGKAKTKSKRSLVEKRKVLKAHAERGRRGGRRGNTG